MWVEVWESELGQARGVWGSVGRDVGQYVGVCEKVLGEVWESMLGCGEV